MSGSEIQALSKYYSSFIDSQNHELSLYNEIEESKKKRENFFSVTNSTLPNVYSTLLKAYGGD